MENIIIGRESTREIFIDNVPLTPEDSQIVFNHSPDGFNWGSGGSGPAQLALAILLKFTDEDRIAVQLHQKFKFEIVSRLPQGLDFICGIDVARWIDVATMEELLE